MCEDLLTASTLLNSGARAWGSPRTFVSISFIFFFLLLLRQTLTHPCSSLRKARQGRTWRVRAELVRCWYWIISPSTVRSKSQPSKAELVVQEAWAWWRLGKSLMPIFVFWLTDLASCTSSEVFALYYTAISSRQSRCGPASSPPSC